MEPETAKHKQYPIFLFIVYIMIWVFLAFNVFDRTDWWLENILVFALIPVLLWTYHRFRLSNVSYTLIFIFLVLHAIGAHYTYAEVPLGFWLQEFFGLTRNHFDRIVHFSFGFLLAYPVREIFLRIASTVGFWGYWLPLELTLAFSAVYELMEWGIAEIVSPGAGAAFLGSQGDQWDAQKDMGLAGLGALIAMCVTAAFNWHYNRRFKAEIKESFEVKVTEPLGEVKLAEMKEELKEELKAEEVKEEKEELKAATKKERLKTAQLQKQKKRLKKAAKA